MNSAAGPGLQAAPAHARWWHHAALLLMLVAVPALAGAAERGPLRTPPSAAQDDPDGARVIVKYKALGGLMRAPSADGALASGPQHAATLGGRFGLALRDGRSIDRRSQVVFGDAGMASATLAARLAADADVEYAVPDQRRQALALPNDPLLAASAAISPVVGQWYLRAPDATAVSAINAVGAWALSTGSASVVVASLDTGVLFNHPDLTSKLHPGYDFISSSTTAGDGGGRDADATDPGDWTSASECGRGQSATSSSWHGTQTASLIGAQTGNGLGMASVGYNVMLLPVRVLGKCGGVDSDIIAGMLWAGGVSSLPLANPHPARVINLSLGSSGSCSAAYADAVRQLNAAGVVVVAAAGNDEGLAVGTPANCAGVLAVAGVRHVGTKVGYSNVGPEVALAAPAGNCVNSTGSCLYPIITASNSGSGSAVSNTYTNASDYAVGTSFSSPLVAGTVALMLSVNPSLTPTQVKTLLTGSVRAFPSSSTDATVLACHAPNGVAQDECLCTTSTCGAGMLDAAAAVASAAQAAVPVASMGSVASSLVVGDRLLLDASASSAPSGRTLAGYAWQITSGSTVATLDSAVGGVSSGATAAVTTRAVGNFSLQLTVTDSAGQQASTSAAVNVKAPAAPVVSLLASADVVAAGSAISFDGSGSTVASGLSVASYQWTVTAGAALASISSATNASQFMLATLGKASGVVTVMLTVTDSLGQTASASRSVSISAVTPTAVISQSAATAQVGSSVTLDGSGSQPPAGRSLVGYQWQLVSGATSAALVGTGQSAAVSLQALLPGSVMLSLTVTDSAGATATTTTSLEVQAVVVVSAVPTTTTATSSGGGGLRLGWLAGLLLVVVGLLARRPGGRRSA